MSQSDSSEGESSGEFQLAGVLDQGELEGGFMFQPRREDFPELFEEEWGEVANGDNGVGESEEEEDEEEDVLEGRAGNTNWCKCENCGPMETERESFCCQELPAAFLNGTDTSKLD